MAKQVETGTSDFKGNIPPDFSGMKCFVLDGAGYGNVVRMLALAGFEQAKTVDDADCVVFTGGADIDPALYGEKACPETSYVNKQRDAFEVEVYRQAVEKQKFIFGICRGLQFIHAMRGGKLWQHVSGHGGVNHWIVDVDEDVRVLANSYHHQMLVMPTEEENEDVGMELVATTETSVASSAKNAQKELIFGKDSDHIEIEAAWYPEVFAFGVQGHPEWGSKEYMTWCLNKLHEYMLEWEWFTLNDDGDEDDFEDDDEEPGVEPLDAGLKRNLS